MGWFFRKSKKVGPFRINLSKSGVGFSVGTKGARVSVGPKGSYFNAGSNGLYYREKLGKGYSNNSKNSNQTHTRSRIQNVEKVNTYSNTSSSSNGLSGVPASTDSSYSSIDNFSKEISHALPVPKIAAIIGIVLTVILFSENEKSDAAIFWSFVGAVVAFLTAILFKLFKVIRIEYEMDSTQVAEWDKFCEALMLAQDSDVAYLIARSTGASTNHMGEPVKRVYSLWPKRKSRFYTKCNTQTVAFATKRQLAIFFPDRVIIRTRSGGIVTILYKDLDLKQNYFIVENKNSEVKDAAIESVHWLYETKDGFRDLRYKDNPSRVRYRYDSIIFEDNRCTLVISMSRDNLRDVIVNRLEDYIDKYREWEQQNLVDPLNQADVENRSVLGSKNTEHVNLTRETIAWQGAELFANETSDENYESEDERTFAGEQSNKLDEEGSATVDEEIDSNGENDLFDDMLKYLDGEGNDGSL